LFNQEQCAAVYEFVKNYAALEPDSYWCTDYPEYLEKAVEFWKKKANS